MNMQIETQTLPEWYEIAQNESMKGIMEVPGDEDHPDILKYHRSMDRSLPHDEISWCSSFVNWCVEETEIRGTRNPAARSWLNWGRPIVGPSRKPYPGCIVVMWRNTRYSWTGHVGFYVGEDFRHIFVLGGNQKDCVCIQAYPKDKLLGYREPESDEWKYDFSTS